MQVLRWHVARLHDGEGFESQSQKGPLGSDQLRKELLDVAIASATEHFLEKWTGPDIIAAITEDQLDWWRSEEEKAIEGWIEADLIVIALAENAAVEHQVGLSQVERTRRITEDMVFLQCVPDADELRGVWDKLKNQGGLPNVAELVALKGSRWLDFTQQARRMAKTVYLKTLGEFPIDEEDRGGDDDAAK